MSELRTSVEGRSRLKGAFFAAVLCAAAALTAARAQTVTFDFDTATPHYSTGVGLPVSQTAGGLTAIFGSTSSSGFSLQSQSTTFFTLRQFSGIYLYPNNMNRNHLAIQFSQPLTDITFTFATIEYQDNAEVPSYIRLTAYMGTVPVGSATARGAYLGDTFPMGTLTFHATGQPFDMVDIFVPYTPVGTTEFLSDNFIVRGAGGPSFAGSIPDGDTVPGSPLFVNNGVGGAIDLYWSASCLASDVDYAIYEGLLGDFTSHLSRQCTTSAATWATIVPSAGNHYYLIVPHNGSVEGSYGRNSSLVERPPSPGACFPQSIGGCS